MVVPKTLKVGALTYSVKRGDKKYHDATNSWGETHHEDQTIHLQENMSKEREGETLLHEIMHCAFAMCGLGYQLDHNKPMSEEEIVNASSRAIYQIIKENKLEF